MTTSTLFQPYPLGPLTLATLYGGGEEGCTDYPAVTATLAP